MTVMLQLRKAIIYLPQQTHAQSSRGP